MKAIVVHRAGGPEVLRLEERPIPQVKPGWSVIKIKAFGINRSEIFTRQGFSPQVTFPRILGIECVGEIFASSDTERLPYGQKVLTTMGEMGRQFDGSYAQYVLVPNEQIFPIATDLSWENLAAIPETYFTSYGSMLQLQLQAGDRILVRAAASGVGVAFVKLVKAHYPELVVVASVRNLAKKEQLFAVGYDQVILDKAGCLQTEATFTKILELVGPKVIKDSLKHLDMGGIICATGLLGGQWYLKEFDPTEALRNNVYLTTFYSGNVSAQGWQELLDYIAKYQVDVRPQRVFSLEQIQEAHKFLESSQAFGKVIIRNED
ncbi:zinc-binding alcohol dehydrogenase family protein [Ligilactobacillus equi]|nr:zinc-binding alcohol dehydrogenase family protein [Ligilactobacillus equi]